LTLAFAVLAREVQPPAVAAACCATLAEAAGACGMVGGQADDVAAENDECGMMNDECQQDGDPAGAPSIHHSSFINHHSLAALESMHRRKTGALILAPLQMGAMIAGANPEQLVALDGYGQRLGLAFQITDDLLDVQSNEAAAGKRVGKDAQRGKLTFPGLLGLDQSTQHAAQLISEASEALALFGEEAEGLRVVAHFVLERKH
jgi:geranylgeranyl diphosphate synthase type II